MPKSISTISNTAGANIEIDRISAKNALDRVFRMENV